LALLLSKIPSTILTQKSLERYCRQTTGLSRLVALLSKWRHDLPKKMATHVYDSVECTHARSMNLIGAQKRSGFVAALLTLTAFGRAKARRDSLRESLNLHLLT